MGTVLRVVGLIEKKRRGQELTEREIEFLIDGYMKGRVAEYQMAALLMAFCLAGMSASEALALTKAMLRAAKPLELRDVPGQKLDKHSSGGVGDKVSLVLAPLAAAMGLKVPMLSGRGLGHTGGTLDKLSSIPGLRTELSPHQMKAQLRDVGLFMAGQTEELAPVDRRLYALRDATATVASVGLIASSIMSKKLAEDLDALVLDVKVGSGAFAQSLPEARALAALMVQIGARMGLPTVAVITDMSEPLGRAVGNALEVKEALSALRGRASEDLMEVTLTLTAYMLHLADALSAEQPPQRLSAHVLKRYKDECMDYIEHGDAFARLLRMVDAQGGDAEALLNPSLLPRAEHVEPVEAPEEGYLQALDAYWVGQAALLLGAGRDRIDASVDVAAGLILAAKPPDELKKGQPLAMLHTNDPALLGPAKEAFLEGVRIGQRPPAPRRLVHEVLLSPQG